MPEIGVKRNNNVKKSRQRVRTSGKKDERDWEEGPKAVLQKPSNVRNAGEHLRGEGCGKARGG